MDELRFKLFLISGNFNFSRFSVLGLNLYYSLYVAKELFFSLKVDSFKFRLCLLYCCNLSIMDKFLFFIEAN